MNAPDALRGFPSLAKAHILETVRSKTALFWTLLFPLIFLFFFGFVISRGDRQTAAYLFPGALTTSVIAGSFMGVSMRMVTARENGVLRRLRVTPLTQGAVVLSYATLGLFTLALTLAVQVVVIKLLFRTPIASPLLFLLASACGVVAFVPLGLLVGSVAKDMKTAPAITNLIFFPMMILSGAAYPYAFMPDFVRKLGRFLPSTYLNDALQGTMVRGDSLSDLAAPFAVLLLTALAGVGVNALLFRWESDQPIDGRRLATSLSGLAALFTATALLAPDLAMSSAPGSSRPDAGASKGRTRVLRGVTVLDGLGGRIEKADVVLQENRVAEIRTAGATNRSPLPKDAVVDDLSGKFLVPGLFDAHVHLNASAGGLVPSSRYEFSTERPLRDLQAYLGVGVTAVVSMYDDPEAVRRLREDVRRGRMRAPRVFLSGPVLTAPGGFPVPYLKFVPGLAEKLTRQVATAEEAKKAVEELDGLNVNVVELVYSAGGNRAEAWPKLGLETLRAALAEAKKRRLLTTVLVDTDAAAREALEAGADGIEHVPSDLSDETIRLFVTKGATLTPALASVEGLRRVAAAENVTDALVQRWTSPQIVASLFSKESFLVQSIQKPAVAAKLAEELTKMREAVGRAHRAGVKLLAGTNAGNPGSFHGPALIRELELLVEAGLSPGEALQAATSRSADRLRLGSFGRIQPEAVADLLVLGSDPTADVAAFRDVKAVYLNGLPLDRDKLFETPAGRWMP